MSLPFRKAEGLFCGHFLRKGEVYAYGGLPHNLKDLKNHLTHPPHLKTILWPVYAAILCTGWLRVIRKDAGSFC